MFKRLAILWTLLRGEARALWRALRHPLAPGWLKMGTAALVLYALSPIDFIPDFIPFIGEVDDVFVIVMALQRLISNAGRAVVADHWMGEPGELSALNGIAGSMSEQVKVIHVVGQTTRAMQTGHMMIHHSIGRKPDAWTYFQRPS